MIEAAKQVPKHILIERLMDYERMDQAALLAALVAKWREYHPAAAQEQSAALKPLDRHELPPKTRPDEADDIWYNDTYEVTVRRHKKDRVFGSDGGMIQLGIASHDGTARHDWRDFQAIKNQLAGPECEAFELFPAESRLVDPSNYYTLWCFPGVRRLRIGLEERRAFYADRALAPQRALPKAEGSPA